MSHWETLDVAALLNRREEQTTSGGAGGTTSANVGAYPVPIGRPLRAVFPTVGPGYAAVSDKQRTRHESADAAYDRDYQWALAQLK